MSNPLSKPAFITWALIPPFIAWVLYTSDNGHGYVFVYGGIFASMAVLLAALLIGWLSKTAGESLLGTLAGFVLIAIFLS